MCLEVCRSWHISLASSFKEKSKPAKVHQVGSDWEKSHWLKVLVGFFSSFILLLFHLSPPVPRSSEVEPWSDCSGRLAIDFSQQCFLFLCLESVSCGCVNCSVTYLLVEFKPDAQDPAVRGPQGFCLQSSRGTKVESNPWPQPRIIAAETND